MIKRSGAFITYGPEDFVPGHSEFCSYQLGDPAKCPVCKPSKPRRAKALIACASLVLSACAGAPIVAASPSSCATLLPPEWKQGVAGAPLPDGNTVADWEVFGDLQTGKLDVANGRTKDAIGIIERCEQRDAAAIKKATRRKFLGLFG